MKDFIEMIKIGDKVFKLFDLINFNSEDDGNILQNSKGIIVELDEVCALIRFCNTGKEYWVLLDEITVLN